MKSPSNDALKWVALAWDHTHRCIYHSENAKSKLEKGEVETGTTCSIHSW